jgi:hypothetical protein
MKEIRSRTFFCVFNNPSVHGYEGTPELICNKLRDEWCTSDNRSGIWAYCISDDGLHHVHMALCDKMGLYLSKILGKYAVGTHFEIAKGSKKEIDVYIQKIGKYAEKGEKVIYICRAGELLENDIKGKGIVELVKSGYSDYDIINYNSDLVQHIEDIRKTRYIIDSHNYSDCFRQLNVHYIFGDTGLGKTKGVMQHYGFKNVYRHTDYDRGYFDFYEGQSVVIFDEFRSQFNIVKMLNYLDGYPLMLPARYVDKVAKFTEVYIISNINLSEQYKTLQKNEPKTWLAFLRRINDVTYYNRYGKYTYSLHQNGKTNKILNIAILDSLISQSVDQFEQLELGDLDDFYVLSDGK